MSETRHDTHPFWQFFIDNHRVTYLIIFAIVLGGVFTVLTLPRESSPEVDIPVAVITTVLPGADAQSVEDLVTNPIEDQISGMSNVTSLTSVSSQGVSSVTIEFEPNADDTEVIADIRSRVDRASGELPDDATDPIVQKVSFSDVPIMTLALSTSQGDAELKQYAEILQDELETIGSVSRVNIVGVPQREIRLDLDRDALNQFDLTASDVIASIANSSIDTPLGAVEAGGTVYTLRFDAELVDGEDVRRARIAERGGAIITVGDVAVVTDDFVEENSITRLGGVEGEARPTVSVQIFKESGEGNILAIADEAVEIAQVLSTERFTDAEIKVVQSDADLIREDLNTLLSSGIVTMILVLVILSLFLGWREAFLASLVVPLSFLMAFIAIGMYGLTINFLTLFSLILALGILVDAAIVVTESIFTKRTQGMSAHDAALATITDFQLPLITGTMTTVIAFASMFMTSGIIGEFIFSIPLTVSAVLISALFVGLGIVTTLATRFLKTVPAVHETSAPAVKRILDRLYAWYARTLERILNNRGEQKSFVRSVTVLFIITLGFMPFGIVSVNMFPAPDSDIIFLDLEAPRGTPLAQTSSLLRLAEQTVAEQEGVDFFLTTVGRASQSGSIETSASANGHIGSMVINLLDDRSQTSAELVSTLQKQFQGFPGADVLIAEPGGGPPQGKPIQVQIVGEDLGAMEALANRFGDELRDIDGAVNINNGVTITAGEFQFDIDRDVAQLYGVTVRQVADTLRVAVSGVTASEIRTLTDEVDIVVGFDIARDDVVTRGSVDAIYMNELLTLPVRTPRGNVSLDTFVDGVLVPGRSSIVHDEGKRVITVSSDAAPGFNAQSILGDFQDRISNIDVPEGMTLNYGGEAEDIQESFTDLGKALVISIIAIFVLMVWQFKSYRQPVFIMITIPLALTGVFIGLAIVGQPFSFPGFIGVVALSGVVVNNAIILIDAINKERREHNKDTQTAVLDGATSRLQPIVLTTVTTIAGLLPLVFTSDTWAPIAYSIIFGLMFSSVLTLFVVPILYLRFAEKEIE